MTASKDITSESGQTMTEFALIMPLLLVLLFGVVQFGIAFNNYVALTDAVRAGARKAVVSREDPDPVGQCTTAVRNAATNLKQASLTVSCSSTWKPGTDVQVTGAYPYRISLLGWVVKNGSLTTVMRERVE